MNERRSDEETVDVVRRRYGEIAKAPAADCGCSGTSPEATSRLLGYSADELDALPGGANLGVGCAAPLAHAHLRASARAGA
jgi:arsenite methyltransferase